MSEGSTSAEPGSRAGAEGPGSAGPSAPTAFQVDGGLGLLTLQRPPANALGEGLVDGLAAACDGFDAVGVKVVVVRSSVPGYFAAGADLKLLGSLDRSSFEAYLDRLRGVLDRIEAAPWVSVAALDGFALGGGLELALACTLRVASARARLGVPEVKLGLLPGAGGTQRLPRMVPRGAALDLLLTGRSAGGEEALRLGLIDRLVDDDSVDAAAREWAASFADGPGLAYAAIKRCVDAAGTGALRDGLGAERAEVLDLFDTADGREGVAAFLEKRAPRFG
jgi:enoyl-CoA hydratase